MWKVALEKMPLFDTLLHCRHVYLICSACNVLAWYIPDAADIFSISLHIADCNLAVKASTKYRYVHTLHSPTLVTFCAPPPLFPFLAHTVFASKAIVTEHIILRKFKRVDGHFRFTDQTECMQIATQSVPNQKQKQQHSPHWQWFHILDIYFLRKILPTFCKLLFLHSNFVTLCRCSLRAFYLLDAKILAWICHPFE